MKQIALRDLTEREYRVWLQEKCCQYKEMKEGRKQSVQCPACKWGKCPFSNVQCNINSMLAQCWIYNKELYSESFLSTVVTIKYDGTTSVAEKERLRQLTDKYLSGYKIIQVARISVDNGKGYRLRLVCKNDTTHNGEEFFINKFRIETTTVCTFDIESTEFDNMKLNQYYPLHKLLQEELEEKGE